jgi:hypothetical protein
LVYTVLSSFTGLATSPEKPRTKEWRKDVLEAEERLLPTRHDASVAHETTYKRRRDDEVSSAQSNAAEAAEMDEDQGEDGDEAPIKRLLYDEAAVPADGDRCQTDPATNLF